VNAPDDSSIANDDVLLRWNQNSKHQLVKDGERKRPSSGSLIPHPGNVLSVYLVSELQSRGMDEHDVLQACAGDSVWALEAGQARSLGCGIVRDPADAGLPVDPAHALLTLEPDLGGKPRRRTLSKLAKAMRHVAGPVTN
jgi:hypothetical protein